MCFDSFYLPNFMRMIVIRRMRQQEMWYAGKR